MRGVVHPRERTGDREWSWQGMARGSDGWQEDDKRRGPPRNRMTYRVESKGEPRGGGGGGGGRSKRGVEKVIIENTLKRKT